MKPQELLHRTVQAAVPALRLTELPLPSGNSAMQSGLSGTNQYLTLPSGIVSSLNDFTVSAWIKMDTVSNWVRIFDFGENTDTYMFLTPKSAYGTYRFGITTESSGKEQLIDADPLSAGAWHHVAVTLNGSEGILT
jgi:hypothetical protein